MKDEQVLQMLDNLGPDYERAALPQSRDHVLETLAWLESRPVSGRRFAFGLDERGLWEPYRLARDKVELYSSGPQEKGLALDWLDYDASAALLSAGLYGLSLPARCGRFFNRQCPLLEPMGHEPSHPECNYWAWPRFEELAPKIELYPEWQRFDCHHYYPLFQATLVLGELATALGARWTLAVAGRQEKGAAKLKEYADLTADAGQFEWVNL